MGCVEFVEPAVERRHALSPIELVGDSALCQRRHVQPSGAGLLVEVVREADVPAGDTHILHTDLGNDSGRSAVIDHLVELAGVRAGPSGYLRVVVEAFAAVGSSVVSRSMRLSP